MQEIEDKKSAPIFCKEHKRRDLKFANLDYQQNKAQSPLGCQVCYHNCKYNHLFVSIGEILENDDGLLILNWPKGMKQECKDFLETHSDNIESEMNQLRNQISHFYDEMTEQMVVQIRELKKQNLMVIDQHESKIQELYTFYNQAFRRQELKDLFRQMDTFSPERYSEFLNSLEETRQKDLDSLEKAVQQLVDSGRNYWLKSERQQAIKNKLKNIISSMSFQFNLNSLEKSSQTVSLEQYIYVQSDSDRACNQQEESGESEESEELDEESEELDEESGRQKFGYQQIKEPTDSEIEHEDESNQELDEYEEYDDIPESDSEEEVDDYDNNNNDDNDYYDDEEEEFES